MKQFLAILIASTILLLTHHEKTKAASMIDSVIQRGVLRVGFSSFVPWAMQNKDGTFIGFEVDIAKKLAKDLGVDIQLIPTPWSGIIPALLTNKFDIIIGGLNITTERNLRVNFTTPYDYAYIEILAHAKKIKNMSFPEDFNNPKTIIAIRSGSIAAIPAKKLLPKATFRFFDDETIATQDLLSGNAHLLFASTPLPKFTAIASKGTLVTLDVKPLAPQPVGFAIQKGDYDSINVLNNWIDAIKNNNWLDERKKYWFQSKEWESLLK